MARFLPEYKELDLRSTWEKFTMTASFVLLFLFVPMTVLGYFSESSLPGQTLYPLKRGIESMVLLVESFTPYNKSLYYQTLAARRVHETATIIAQTEVDGSITATDLTATDIGLVEIVTTVKQAAAQTQTISNPAQKKQAQQQLAQSISTYQTQLNQINYSIQAHLLTPTPTGTTNTNTQSADTTSTGITSTETQIQQTQTQLQTISDNLQASASSTLAPTPTPTLTPTPTPKTENHEGTSSHRNH